MTKASSRAGRAGNRAPSRRKREPKPIEAAEPAAPSASDCRRRAAGRDRTCGRPRRACRRSSSIGPDSDVRAFLAPGVPAASDARRAAPRLVERPGDPRLHRPCRERVGFQRARWRGEFRVPDRRGGAPASERVTGAPAGDRTRREPATEQPLRTGAARRPVMIKNSREQTDDPDTDTSALPQRRQRKYCNAAKAGGIANTAQSCRDAPMVAHYRSNRLVIASCYLIA